LVRCRNRTGWAVDEARLYLAPGLYEARSICRRQRPDVKPLDSLCALFERGFRMPPVAVFLHGAGILSATELSAQSFRPALPLRQEHGDTCG
jgi:hypothetical protein